MQLILLFIQLIALWQYPSGGTLNVRNFGATGDGVTDDTQAINLALKAAAVQQADLYFPSGTYLCNTADVSGNILIFWCGSTQSLTIYGQDSTSIIRTNLATASVLFYLAANGPCSEMVVRNLNFQNVHAGLATTTSNGLFITGTAAQNFSNLKVSNCYFEGFSQALCGMGINGWTVTKNFFGAPLGHDNAGDNTNPAVFLWCFDNESGRCLNVSITNNTADGYTGTAPMSALVTHRPMDGFVFGTGYGFTITGNTTRHFSEEHYVLQPKSSYPSDTTTALVSNNYLDCSLVTGIANSDGSPHTNNYGIRPDISNAVITNNTIVNYSFGIIVRAVEYPTITLHSYVITGNQLHSATDSVLYTISAGILIQTNTNPITGIRIIGNDIYTPFRDYPNNQRSIRVEKTQSFLHSLITQNTLHLIQ